MTARHATTPTTALSLVLLALTFAQAEQEPTVVSTKLTPAYVAGNTDVLHAVHTPDSSRVLYVQSTDGTQVGTLYSVPVAGGTPVALLDQVGGDPASPGFAVTPDGTRVVASRAGTLFAVPVAGGTPVQLLEGLSSFVDFHRNPSTTPFFVISPDSSTVATIAREDHLEWTTHALFTVPVAGGEPVNVSGTDALSGWFDFSADSQTVYYQGVHNETTLPPMFFYQTPADGSVPSEPIAFEPGPGPGPRWPTEGGSSPVLLPDGSAIIYLASPNGNGLSHEIRLVDLATRTGVTLAPSHASHIASFELSHDASYLFVTRGHVTGWLESVNIADRTSTVLVDTGRDIRDPTLSPDGSTVVYVADDKIFAQSPSGGPRVALTASNVVQLAGFKVVGITQDNARAVFLATGDGSNSVQLYSNALDGTDLRRLTSPIRPPSGLRFDPVLSKDGIHVLYRADLYNPGDDYLFRVPAEGGGSLLLHFVGPPAGDVDAVIETPDGTGVTFIADLNHNAVDELFHRPYRADAAHRLSIPGSGDGRLSGYTVTPDSAYVLFRAQARSPGKDELFATTTTGGPAWRLNKDLPPKGDVRSRSFQPTPDGTHVVYRADADTNAATELYITTVASPSESLKLHPDLNEDQAISAFAVSPDNVHIAMRGDIDDESTHNLYIVKRDGTGLTRVNLPLNTGRDVNQFLWSPDGAFLAFLAPPPDGPRRINALYLYEVATGELQDVLEDRNPDLSLPSDPRFSPDGKTLLFYARNNLGTRIYLAPVDASDIFPTGILPLSNQVARETQFTSDGKFLVVYDHGPNAFLAVPVDGSEARVLDTPHLGVTHFDVAPETGHVVAAMGAAPQFRLVSIPLDGSPHKVLHVHDGHQRPHGRAVASPDGRTALVPVGGTLFLAPLDGPAEIEPVAPQLELYDAIPTYTFAAGGAECYFVARPVGSVDPYSLYHYDFGHETLTPIPGTAGFLPTTLTITPDGRQALYIAAATTPGVLDLYTTRPAVRHTAVASAAGDTAVESTFNGGNVDTSATEAVFGLALEPYFTGLRFPGLKVEPLTRVHAAHLELTASRSSGGPRDLLVDLHATTDTPPFVSGPGHGISDRPTAPFGPVAWPTDAWQVDTTYTSPDLSHLFDYLFSSDGWQPHNPAGFTLAARGGIVDPADVHYAALVGAGAPRLEVTTYGHLDSGPLQRTPFPLWASALGLGADPTADGDGDGLPLVVEYALGLDPESQDAAPTPGIIFSSTVDGDFAPTVVYVHPAGRTSTDLVLESSTDLKTWSPVALTSAGRDTITFGDAHVSELAFPGGFLTSQVSLPLVTEQTRTVHFRFRVSLTHP